MMLPIDHVGYLVPELDPLVDRFRALGFQVVGPAALDTGDESEGVAVQRSAHVMLRNGYIELTAVERWRPGHHLERFRGALPGMRLLLLGCADAASRRVHLSEQGVAVTSASEASRLLAYGDNGIARFRWFGLPDMLPETLVGYVQHLDLEAVFDEAVMRHPNGAKRLATVFYRDGVRHGRLDALEAEGIGFLPCAGPPGTDLVGLSVTTGSLDAFGSELDKNRVPFERDHNWIVVSPEWAGGAFLQVTSDPSTH